MEAILAKIPNDVDLYDVCCDDSGAWWVVGCNGSIYRSDDRGGSWDSVASGTKQVHWMGVTCLDGVVYAVGADEKRGYLVRGDASGFSACDVGGREGLCAVATDGRSLFLCGSLEIARSDDGGDSWQTVHKGFLGNNSLLADAAGAVCVNSAALWSRDGASFTEAALVPELSPVREVMGNVGGPLYVVSHHGLIRSEDGGQTWTRVRGPVRRVLQYGGCVSAKGDVWTVGYRGLALKGLEEPETVPTGVKTELKRVRALGDAVVAVGDSGVVVVLEG